MLKYFDFAIVFQEFPEEIALAINITNCPCHCEKCSEPWLQQDAGTELTEEELDKLITTHKGITLVGFMGGDNDHERIKVLTNYIHEKYNLKVGMYSGFDSLDINLLDCLDYYKIGRWIFPKGEVSSWWKQNCGPIKFTFSNQLMFKKIKNHWVNITNEFRKIPLNNLQKEII